jgi:hypothetical protein
MSLALEKVTHHTLIIGSGLAKIKQVTEQIKNLL